MTAVSVVRSIFEQFSAAGTDLVAGAHLSTTGRTIEHQFHTAGRTEGILLAYGRTTVRAEGLAASMAAVLVRAEGSATDRALAAELQAALGTAGHLWRQVGTAPRAAEFQLCAAGGAEGVILAYGCATRRAERLAATGAIGQPQPHAGTAGWTGPGRVQSTVGTVDFFILQ